MRIPSLTTQQHKLILPDEVREVVKERWVSTQSSKAHQSLDDAPFDRIIDFWFMSVVFAAGKKLTPVEQPTGKSSFVSLGPNQNDIKKVPEWWPEMLMMIAVAAWGYDDERCQSPAELVKLANCYAEAGSVELLKFLDERTDMGSARLYVLANLLTEICGDVGKAYEGSVF